MHDWDARALPSAERCERWRAAGGVWFGEDRVYQQQTCEGVGRFMLAVGGCRLSDGGADPTATAWRPMTKDRNPATWSDFYAATHPPIPEGWEKVGEWYTPILATDAAAGIVPCGGSDFMCSGDGYAVEVRRIAQPVTWADVPEGVNLPHCGYIPVERDGKRVGIVFPHGALWRSLTDGTPSQYDDHPSLPAAIVALTGGRK